MKKKIISDKKSIGKNNLTPQQQMRCTWGSLDNTTVSMKLLRVRQAWNLKIQTKQRSHILP